MKYAFIKAHSQEHKVVQMVAVLGVSSSGYYDWLDRPESPRSCANRSLVTKIGLFHKASRCIYGSPRIHEDLLEHGETVGVNRVARLMRTGTLSSLSVRWAGWSSSWLVLLMKTLERRSKVSLPSGLG